MSTWLSLTNGKIFALVLFLFFSRYSDFIVNEVGLDGNVVHLTSLEVPPEVCCEILFFFYCYRCYQFLFCVTDAILCWYCFSFIDL